jgi:hypothetical protein
MNRYMVCAWNWCFRLAHGLYDKDYSGSRWLSIIKKICQVKWLKTTDDDRLNFTSKKDHTLK